MEQMLQEIEASVSTEQVAEAIENTSQVNHFGTNQFNMIAFDQE